MIENIDGVRIRTAPDKVCAVCLGSLMDDIESYRMPNGKIRMMDTICAKKYPDAVKL